jgi:hypothetical protein
LDANKYTPVRDCCLQSVTHDKSRRSPILWRSRGVLICNLVDNVLDGYDLHVDVAGYVGEEFGHKIVDGGCGEGGAVARRAGRQISLPARHIEVAELVKERRNRRLNGN